MPVFCILWVCDSFWVEWWFWLPCHITNTSWISAILCNVLSSSSLFSAMLVSAPVISNTQSSLANILLWARTHHLASTFSRTASPGGLDCLHPIASRPMEQLVSTPTPCRIIPSMSCAAVALSAYFGCIYSCCCHQSVILGNQNVLSMSMGLEW